MRKQTDNQPDNQVDTHIDTQAEDASRIEASYPKNRTAIGGPRLGIVGWVRWFWRQLTSMRTALFLLLLLALAAIPGSIFPQRPVDAARTRRWIEDNPDTAPWLDRLGMFDVYASPWFASIYLLLMISLIGCIIPRARQHIAAMRAQPPRAPRRLDRLPVYRHTGLHATPSEVSAAARVALGERRFRIRRAAEGEGAGEQFVVSAEKGYLKETGNLLFHLAILGVIISVAVGHLFGWRGEIIVKEGETFTTGAGAFDTLTLGPLVDEADIPQFSVRLDRLDVQFESQAEGAQFGQPRKFEGVATVQEGDEPARGYEFAVNHPLHVSGTSLFLLGNGYAPVVTVRDGEDAVVFQDAVTFLPQDNVYSSSGVIKVTGTQPNLGFVGGFLPTLTFDEEIGPTSAFPGLADPALVLTAFEGNLFPDGRAQSVFSIETDDMDQLMQENGEPVRLLIRPGETLELPEGKGSIEMENVIRWAGLLVRHDPGRLPALAFSGVALLGLVLMLGVRRRRVFVRVEPGERHTGIGIAGLPKGTDPGLEDLVDQIMGRIVTATGGREVRPDDVGDEMKDENR
ncbi:cytochrome c biogenesis protein ResB [Ornithinimicrobium sp. Y1694]|uniref:cytochrome c biogenesis protein ResB n=1 Tax=Ornithinimicrobium sp. Y1694 TaxID=3418590 RepID=UPI003CEE379F